MSFKEANLKIFEGEKMPFVLFQPRFEPWYNWHKKRDILPDEFKNSSVFEIYDKLKVSMRYLGWTGIWPIETKYAEKVKVKDEDRGNEYLIVIDTPYGEIIRKQEKTSDGRWMTVEFPVKEKNDFKKLAWLYRNTVITFSKEKFEKGSEIFGERGYPQFYVPRSPYQRLWIEWMKYEDLIYALHDYPEVVKDTMKAIDESYDGLYEELVSYGKTKIVNFGENIDSNTASPYYFETYCIPFYEKRANRLMKAGIYTHIHIDGSFKPLLKYLKNLPFDGYEALTPLPQGDVTIEEMKESIGDKILIDGIPGILFLPTFSREQLMECVKKLIKLFYPNLVLGISDELPEGVPPDEAMERMKIVSEYCKRSFLK